MKAAFFGFQQGPPRGAEGRAPGVGRAHRGASVTADRTATTYSVQYTHHTLRPDTLGMCGVHRSADATGDRALLSRRTYTHAV